MNNREKHYKKIGSFFPFSSPRRMDRMLLGRALPKTKPNQYMNILCNTFVNTILWSRTLVHQLFVSIKHNVHLTVTSGRAQSYECVQSSNANNFKRRSLLKYVFVESIILIIACVRVGSSLPCVHLLDKFRKQKHIESDQEHSILCQRTRSMPVPIPFELRSK